MQTLTREELEQKGRETVSAELYWDFVNAVEEMADEDIQKIIDCGGNYYREIKDNPTYDAADIAEALAEHGE